MLIVLVILSLGLLGLIIYFAFSTNSTRLQKRVALIALALIGLSIVVCTILLILGPHKDKEDSIPVFQDTAPQAAGSGNITTVIFFIAVFLLILAMVIVLSLRKERKKRLPDKKAGKPQAFEENNNFGFEFSNKPNTPEADDSFDDDSFDIEK